MPERTKYINCDLFLFSLGKQEYKILFYSDIGATAQETFRFPFRQNYLSQFFSTYGRAFRSVVKRGKARPISNAKASIEDFGRELFCAVFVRDVYLCYSRCIEMCAKGDRAVRLRVHLEGAPKLRDLPWEHLMATNQPKALTLIPAVSIVRYPDLPLPLVSELIRLPLTILVAISSPSNAPRLNINKERRSMEIALSDLKKENLVRVEYLLQCTREKLRSKLGQLKSTYHVVHFIGHGGFSNSRQEGVIYLEDENGKCDEVTGSDLSFMLLTNKVSLVFLNMCETARPSVSNPFAAPAEFLVRRGIPCVVGMQFPISDRAAIAFSSVFYRELASGGTLDDCVQKGRLQIEALPNELEWGTPVLYLRTAQDHLFQVKSRNKTKHKTTKRVSLVSDPTDPYKGFAKGKSESAGRRLSAIINKQKRQEGYHNIILRVESINPEKPLKGNVIFYLHPSFQFPKRTVPVRQGIAELQIEAYGAFTIGAETDRGSTKLELDLVNVPGGTKLFYES